MHLGIALHLQGVAEVLVGDRVDGVVVEAERRADDLAEMLEVLAHRGTRRQLVQVEILQIRQRLAEVNCTHGRSRLGEARGRGCVRSGAGRPRAPLCRCQVLASVISREAPTLLWMYMRVLVVLVCGGAAGLGAFVAVRFGAAPAGALARAAATGGLALPLLASTRVASSRYSVARSADR